VVLQGQQEQVVLQEHQRYIKQHQLTHLH
jgi:hypothetical protein